MAAIDIGPGATNRASSSTDGWTYIDLGNPANDTGSLDTMEIWKVDSGAASCKMGTFYGSSTSYTSRDYEELGSVTHGSKQTLTGLNCSVSSGDYLGVWVEDGVEFDSSGYAGIYRKDGDWFGAGTQTYTAGAGDAISIYATGATPDQPYFSYYPHILAH